MGVSGVSVYIHSYIHIRVCVSLCIHGKFVTAGPAALSQIL